ncbi:MAG: DnaJ domain-containing protein [Acidobacteriota bacterium]|nr:DnaJ domain-containing protein [Acidobacteriota bacterium]
MYNKELIPSMDHYQLLGVPKNCDRNTLHRAFRELSKKYHPDRFAESERADAEKKYKQVVVAFNTLKDPRLRARYDRKLKAPTTRQTSSLNEDPLVLARKYFETGITRSGSGQHEAAVECFKRANHYKEDAETYFRLAVAESNVTRLHRDSVAHFQKAIGMKPGVMKYHTEFIKALRTFGLNTRAKVALDKAFEQFPQNSELLEIGRELDPKRYKSGFLGGLFNR